MAKTSAGLLAYRRRAVLEVFVVHPGGPYWARKDEGVWSIPKGELAAGEDAQSAAFREFFEEIGIELSGPAVDLGEIRQKGGKRVLAWPAEADFEAAELCSNTFEMEWPPKSGQRRSFPEVDRGAWLSLADARVKLLAAQTAFLDVLVAELGPRDA